MAVFSNSIPVPKIDRAGLMRTAWKLYRQTYEIFGKATFQRSGFRWALAEAWRRAKECVRRALVPAAAKQGRVDVIKQQIALLDFKSFQINTTPMRQRLEAELASLGA